MSTPTGVLYSEPWVKPLSTVGLFQAGALLNFYLTGTTTPANVYEDGALTTPYSQPIAADSAGRFSPIYLNPATIYKAILTNALGSTLETTDPIVPSPTPSQAQVGLALWPQTAAEASASITPTNYQYPELTLERYAGGTAATATQNNTALTAILAIAAVKGGGTINCPALNAPGGTYQFSGNFTWVSGLNIQGTLGTVANWTWSGSSGTFIFIPHAVGRIEISDIEIYSTGQVGIGIGIGDSSGNGTRITLRRVVMNYWSTALLITGATWSQFHECEFGSALGGTYSAPQLSNNNGVSFAPNNSSNYTSALLFQDCTISNNALTGVGSTNTTVITANNITWLNCTVQNNCVSSTNITAHSAQQFFMGLCSVFTIQGMYMEYVLGGTTQGGASTAPSAISTYGLGYGSISDFYIATAYNGIYDSGGNSCSSIDIVRGSISGVINDAITLTTAPNVVIRAVNGTPISVTGNGSSYVPLNSNYLLETVSETTFSPALAFASSGSLSGVTTTATYSQIGNILFFSIQLAWTGISSPSGQVTITGLPVAPKSGGPQCSFAVYCTGITIAAGSLALVGLAGSTTANLYNVQSTSAAVIGSAFQSSAGSMVISGSYQV